MTSIADLFPKFETKMRGAGCSASAISAFHNSYANLLTGQSGLIPENSIEPVETLPRLESITNDTPSEPAALLQATVIVKLNGGLGTSMGLERAKSLLVVKDGLTFLDLIARQVLFLRTQHQAQVGFLLMNSFSTSADTLKFFEKYPELGPAKQLELMQSQVPKVDAKTLAPIEWPENPQLEWCPPGHGDLYPSVLGSGLLNRWLEQGVKYLFVSNSDNLGATLDLSLLHYFAESGKSFLMEVALRTPSDRKGGHLAKRATKLLLRESAQCPESDLPLFQDIARHRFFNTNNLWIRLDALKRALDDNHGFVPLPLIKNAKTVDPRDKKSPPVFQLETAMGAAIEYFEKSGAMVVPRTRFAPVKTTADLLALRSDAYRVTDDWRILLSEGDSAQPPKLDLDDHYRLVDQMDAAVPEGVPSLRCCRELQIRGPVQFSAATQFHGTVSVTNTSGDRKVLPSGLYNNEAIKL